MWLLILELSIGKGRHRIHVDVKSHLVSAHYHSSIALQINLGHILTKSELEGLRSLMDLYCKEALAKLEKQSENISRDKAEKLLKEHGLEQFANDFEESIQRG